VSGGDLQLWKLKRVPKVFNPTGIAALIRKGPSRIRTIMDCELRIGIIAPEFPPEMGGMQAMALHLATHLATSHQVIVCTKRALRPAKYQFQVLANLRGKTEDDVAVLNLVDVDIWVAMNAGYVAIANELKRPVVAYFHGNDFLNPWVVSAPLLLRLLSRVPLVRAAFTEKKHNYKRAQIAAGMMSTLRVLTNSSNTKTLIHEHYPRTPEVLVCHPGVEERFFQSDVVPDRDFSVLKLLTVSRLQKGSRRKNVAGVLEALSSIKKSIDFRYSIVGEGDDLEGLRELGSKLGLAGQVEFLGRVNDHDLLELYRQADLFVLPVKASAVDVEGFGIVYLEANAAGVPVLCSAAGGAIDAVIDGQTGIVLASSDPRAIADGILRFARSRAAYQPDRLRQFASNFTWKIAAARIEDQILSSLESLAAGKPTGGLVGVSCAPDPSSHLGYDSPESR
jgi:glycosyltransferase involved in cell wall biosynthesis